MNKEFLVGFIFVFVLSKPFILIKHFLMYFNVNLNETRFVLLELICAVISVKPSQQKRTPWTTKSPKTAL